MQAKDYKILYRSFVRSISMATGSLEWTEENTKSVQEYKAKLDSGEISPVELNKSLKDII